MTLQKHILAIFVVAISFFGPALALLILETVSGIKYAPMAAFWNLCIWSAGLALPVTFWFLKKLYREDEKQFHPLYVYLVMFAGVFFATGVHYVNTHLAEPQIQDVELEISKKRRERRSPRGGDSFIVHELYFEFQETEVFGKNLNGTHYVMVKQSVYDAYKVGDVYSLTLCKGLLGSHYTLDTADMISLAR